MHKGSAKLFTCALLVKNNSLWEGNIFHPFLPHLLEKNQILWVQCHKFERVKRNVDDINDKGFEMSCKIHIIHEVNKLSKKWCQQYKKATWKTENRTKPMDYENIEPNSSKKLEQENEQRWGFQNARFTWKYCGGLKGSDKHKANRRDAHTNEAMERTRVCENKKQKRERTKVNNDIMRRTFESKRKTSFLWSRDSVKNLWAFAVLSIVFQHSFQTVERIDDVRMRSYQKRLPKCLSNVCMISSVTS